MTQSAIRPAFFIAALSSLGLAQSPEQVADTLGLSACDVSHVQMYGYPGAPASAAFTFDGSQHTIQLEPISIRSEGFKLVIQKDGDVYEEVAPQIPLTYQGVIPTMPGTIVRASWLADGLHARLRMADGSDFWLEPVVNKIPGSDPAAHALYRSEDVLPNYGTCGTDAGAASEHTPNKLGRDELNLLGGGFNVAELGLDADFEYYQDYGSSVANTTAQMESVINSMNVQYQNDCNITHVVSHVIVRTTSNDPYSSTNPSTLLNQFTNHWNSAQSGVQRDVAELFTGKNLSGSVIGIAWLNGVCNSSGYNVVESDCCGSFASKTDLSAHELGHNWGEGHCSCSGWTMNSFLTSANQFHPTFSAPGITQKGNTLNCIDQGGGGGGECDISQYGTGLGGGNFGTLSSTTDPQLGTNFVWTYSGFASNASGRIVIALQQASIPFVSETILVQYQNAAFEIDTTANSAGAGSESAAIPNVAALIGNTYYSQVGMIDGSTSSGWAFSNGLSLTICN